jgi:hypothetical protein
MARPISSILLPHISGRTEENVESPQSVYPAFGARSEPGKAIIRKRVPFIRQPHFLRFDLLAEYQEVP